MRNIKSRTIVAGIFASLLLSTAFVVTMHPALAATSSTGIVIPLYTYPTDGTWDQIIQAKNAHPSVPVIADPPLYGAVHERLI